MSMLFVAVAWYSSAGFFDASESDFLSTILSDEDICVLCEAVQLAIKIAARIMMESFFIWLVNECKDE